MPKPNFIVYACSRSGSTLLSAILSESEDVFVLNDARMFQGYVTSRPGRMTWRALERLTGNYPSFLLPSSQGQVSRKAVTRFLTRLEEIYLSPSGIDREAEFRKYYYDRIANWNIEEKMENGRIPLIELFDLLYERLMPDEYRNRRYCGAKTPVEVRLFPWLRGVYPEHKAICIIRHPVTNVAAMYKRSMARKRIRVFESPFDVALRRYLTLTNLVAEIGKTYRNARLVKYEDLLENPDGVVQNLLEFLGADPVGEVGQFKYYIRSDYIGNTVDPERDRQLMDVLSAKETAAVRHSCQNIIGQFYSS